MPREIEAAINRLPKPVLITLNFYLGIPGKHIGFYANLIQRTTRTVVSHLKQTDEALAEIELAARLPRYHRPGRPAKRRRKRSRAAA